MILVSGNMVSCTSPNGEAFLRRVLKALEHRGSTGLRMVVERVFYKMA